MDTVCGLELSKCCARMQLVPLATYAAAVCPGIAGPIFQPPNWADRSDICPKQVWVAFRYNGHCPLVYLESEGMRV
jgi:hypothetical protein